MKVTYKCGCEAGGDNVSPSCPIHKKPVVEDDPTPNVNVDMNELSRRVLSMCRHRGWPLGWEGRGVYLHLETSELIEALRGKHGDPVEEAGDVLMVLMSMTAAASLDFNVVMDGMEKKLLKLEVSDPPVQE